MRRGIGIVAMGLGVAALVAAAWSLTGGGRSFHLGGSWFAPVRFVSVTRRVQLRPGATITIDAQAAHVSVRTGRPGVMDVGYTLPRGTFRLTAGPGQVTVSDQVRNLNFGLFAPSLFMRITVPAGSVVTVTSAAGPVTITGLYSRLSVAALAGTVTVRGTVTGQIRLTDAAGPISADFAAAASRASIADAAGSIILDGPWARVESVHAEAGSVTMKGGPAVRTAVSVTVAAGQLQSSMAGLPSGGNGTFSGTVGRRGAGGSLTILATAGSVTLRP
jgi:hypothetical protein